MILNKKVRNNKIVFASNFVLSKDFSTNHMRPFISKRALIGWKFSEKIPKQKRENMAILQEQELEKSERMWIMCHLERDQSSIKGKVMH